MSDLHPVGLFAIGFALGVAVAVFLVVVYLMVGIARMDKERDK